MQPSRESSAIRYYCFLSTLASARIHLLNQESTDESKRLADGLPKKDVYDSFRASPFNSSARPFGSVHSPNILRSPSIVGYSLSPEHNSPITFIYTLLKRNSNSPVEKVHANLQTNDNWTTPFSLPFLPNSSRDICWNLATVKILIFSGAHHRSTTIHSIVCHRLKNDPVRPFPENLSLNQILRNSYRANYDRKLRSLPERNLPARGTRISQSPNTTLRVRLYPCLSYTESFGNFLDRENRTEINRQIQFIRFTTNSTITCSGRLLLGRTRYCTSSIRRITHARANARAVRVKGMRVARGKGGRSIRSDSSIRMYRRSESLGFFLFFLSSTEQE